MKKEIDTHKFRIQVIELPIPDSVSTVWDDKEINISGKHLYVAKLRVTPILQYNITIKFNDKSEFAFPIKQGDYFNTDFRRIFLDAQGVIGSDDDSGDITFYHWFHGNYRNLSPITPRPRFQTFADLTLVQLKGEAEGIHITDAGNLDITDEYGNQQDLDNLLAGTFHPCSPKVIKATTTAKGIIFYKA
ncbi:MAG: hypothetical protein ACW972_03330 [Promethearchaeota archaeon]|jgi:hypothetical protein